MSTPARQIGVADTVVESSSIALTSGKLSQFAATTSAELAGVVSDEVGSGFLMFDADARISCGTQTTFNPAQVGGLLISTAKLVTSGTAYWCYCGVAPYSMTIATIRTILMGNGGGTVVAEVAVASSPTAPTGSAMTLTHIASTGTVTDMTSGAPSKLVSGTVSAAVPKGTPFWIGIRCAYGTTQPTLTSLGRDDARGYLSSTAGASALTGGGTWTATPIAFVAAATQQAPHLVGTTF